MHFGVVAFSQLSHNNCVVTGDLIFSIILGITTVFEGLITAKIDCKGSSIHRPLMNEANKICDYGLAPLVAAFWLMGNMTNYPDYNYQNVWLIGTNDGTSCTWSVPCREVSVSHFRLFI